TARAYNGSNTVALTGGTLVGVIDGDEDDIGINRGNGTMANANVGSGKEVTTNIALSGEAAGNYTLTQPAGITVNIAKADGEDAPDYTAPATLTAKSDETLADVVGLPEGWKWDADPTTPVGEIGERTHKATFTSADENYETVNEDWTITVDEATSINLGVGSKGSPEARQLASSVQTKYYNLRGQPLGATKPTAPGVYLEKHGKHVRKITIH
ncbi:MAG: YDG domain-containing protein, partial [Fibromonadaceae bacterium]|nr:YDG domain-containing protein [Fibromonadaceae bacterium]